MRPDPLIVVAFGNRTWSCEATIEAWLRRLPPRTIIYHGDCQEGADATIDRVARRLGFDVRPVPADWDAARRAGNVRSAGPIRNRRMAEMAQPHMGLGFGRTHKPNSQKHTGTGDMEHVLNEMGVRVTIVARDGDLPW